MRGINFVRFRWEATEPTRELDRGIVFMLHVMGTRSSNRQPGC